MAPPPLTAELLLRAYAMGVFPMAESRDDPEIFWVDPRERGIFPNGGFHLSRSLRRTIQKSPMTVTLNRDFAGVVKGCADRDETWINDEIFALYCELRQMGHAHSLELWDGHTLAGGVYGVTLGAAFFGESMFSRRRDASKIALAYLTRHLEDCGFKLFDTQFLTPHLASLGAIEIPRADYHERLSKALGGRANLTSRPLPDAYSVVQRSTQTS
ncbi:leucyl/phenylalanyl-tRNA--protein transferase [Aliiroseovarius crassostreae]|uniref:leucyl/phenylalanyl-tRNA--protein transferase n=1 Tax=Aliiroseovarius crassostreae TaxID=154981 RepID=UPI0021B019BF|nr:leucyl/phenylalanyl-tRNA--protein transferase [Aliiroseovarius crassostreae]UWQ11870.1 leucyl/phenylalanyl-tRNA--protein transferase [Aliiroseovarius crassostreae]